MRCLYVSVLILQIFLAVSCKTIQSEGKEDISLSSSVGLRSTSVELFSCDIVACPGSLEVGYRGCEAGDGNYEFETKQANSNEICGRVELSQQICHVGLNPANFLAKCFYDESSSGNPTGSDPLAPPPGARAADIDLYECEVTACPQSFEPALLSCVSSNGLQTLRSKEAGNSICGGVNLSQQACKLGLNPATFRAKCFYAE